MSFTELRDELLYLLREASEINGDPAWLRDIREKVFELIRVVPSDYLRHFKMDKILEEWVKDLTQKSLEDKFKCCPKGIVSEEDLEGIVVDVVNGKIVGLTLPEEYKDFGIFITDLKTAIKTRENKIKKYIIERVNRGLTDKMEALNLVYFTDGIYIEIPEKVKLEKPIHIRRFYTDDFDMKFETDIITVGDLSEVVVYDDFLKSEAESKEKKISVTADIYTGKSSKIIYNSVSLVGNQSLTLHRNMVVEDHSYLEDTFAWLGGKVTISKVRNLMIGRGTTVNHNEIVFGTKGENYYLSSLLDHSTDHTKGEITHRGIMKGKSKLVYNGLIKIRKNASQADSFLSSHAILLDREALAFDIPGLEIENNDVRATHSASVSPIDEEQLYYIRSRGIPLDEARKLIVYGFLEPALEKITDERTKERVMSEIDRKWSV